ncbi:hypothetical protein [uncultured Treponema sp.]|uniref:hypothetical protein n=1 Tax=uncultured Treponema sp. TaxID=162155 RepID=UPI0015BC8D70|nr:hypothetical protein [uncultured Treponema sp.]
MKFEKLFESKENKLFKITGEEVPVTEKMAFPVKWSDVEGAEEEYNESFLAKLREELKTLEEKNEFVFLEPVYDKNATPGQFNNAIKHTVRRLKDCKSVIGVALVKEVAEDRDVLDDFMEKISEKHPHYVYFAKTPCMEGVVLY